MFIIIILQYYISIILCLSAIANCLTRSVTMLAPSAFLYSLHRSYLLITLALLSPTCSPEPCPFKAEAIRLWKASSGSLGIPQPEQQWAAKEPRTIQLLGRLLPTWCPTKQTPTASQQNGFGTWLSTLPYSAFGLRKDNSIQVSVGLRLGSALWRTQLRPLWSQGE